MSDNIFKIPTEEEFAAARASLSNAAANAAPPLTEEAFLESARKLFDPDLRIAGYLARGRAQSNELRNRLIEQATQRRPFFEDRK